MDVVDICSGYTPFGQMHRKWHKDSGEFYFFFFFGRGAHGERGNIFNCTFRASSLVLLMGMLRIFRNKVGSAHRIASEAAKHSVQRHIKHFYKM